MAMNKKAVVPAGLLFVAGIILLIVVILHYSGSLSVASLWAGGKYIDRPVFSWVKCEPLSQTSTTTISISSDGSWVRPQYEADDYQITVKTPHNLLGNKLEYRVCPQKTFVNCQDFEKIPTSSQTEINLGHFTRDQYVWVRYYESKVIGWSGLSTSADVQYQPYGLRKYDPLGGVKILNAQSCSVQVTEAWYDRIMNEDLGKLDTAGNQNKYVLEPNEVTFYVSGFVASPEPSFRVTYNGEDAWCQSGTGNIYKINQIATANNVYYVASVDWSDYLGKEDCCPSEKQGEYTCDANFNWVKTEGSECSIFNPCDGGSWTPLESGVIMRYVCQDGYCIQEKKNVACSHNSDCASNQLCDPNTWTCIDTASGDPLPEPQPDNSADCEAKGGTWMTKETEVKKWYNYVGIGEPDVVTESYCKMPTHIIWWIIGVILAFFLGVFVVPKLIPFVRGVLHI